MPWSRRAEAPWRLTMWMFVLFAALAFGLAALGLFSLVALDVAHRGREFAIRMALGASRPAILAQVLARAAVRVAAGVALGSRPLSVASRAMRSLLFGVAPDDGATYAAVLIVVVATVALAALHSRPSCQPASIRRLSSVRNKTGIRWHLRPGRLSS